MDWSIQFKKNRYGKLWRGLIYELLKGVPWEVNETVYHKVHWVSNYRNLSSESLGCFLGHVLVGGASASSWSLGHLKMDDNTAILWSSLAEFSVIDPVMP